MTKLILMLLILSLASPAQAACDKHPPLGALDYIEVGLTALDGLQTRQFIGKPGHQEGGPAKIILGSQPSDERLLISGIVWEAALHTALACGVPREPLFGVVLGFRLYAIHNNWAIGFQGVW